MASPSPTATTPTYPCAGTDLDPTPANLASAQAAVLCLVDQARGEVGMAPLNPDARLQAAAEHHSLDMVTANYFDHTSPRGETIADRILVTGYVPDGATYHVGENLAVGTLGVATPRQIVYAWLQSAEHRANILDPAYRDTGIGIVLGVPTSRLPNQAGAAYAQEFGVVG